MAKFEVNQKVNVTHPIVGGTAIGTVLSNSLIGKYPLLVKVMAATGDELCMQTGADGDGIVEAIEKVADAPKHTDVVAYVYADGKASPWQIAGSPQQSYSKPAVGAMKAKRLGNVYYDHKYIDLNSETQNETAKDEVPFLDRILERAAKTRLEANKGEAKPEGEIGRFEIKLDESGNVPDGAFDHLPPEVRGVLDKLFGKNKGK